MVIIPIVSLILMNFMIVLKRFANMRSLIVEHILLYSWILVPLVNQNKGTLVPPSWSLPQCQEDRHHRLYPLPIIILEFLTHKPFLGFCAHFYQTSFTRIPCLNIIDPPSTHSSSTIVDDAYVNLPSQVDALGTSTTSFIHSSSLSTHILFWWGYHVIHDYT